MPEQRSLRGVVAGVADRAEDPRALWRGLGEAGLIERLGSSSQSDPAVDAGCLNDLLSELDARLPVGPVLSVCAQVALAVPLLRTVAQTSEYARSVLAGATAGRAVVAVAATEAGLSGSATLDARTAVRYAGGAPHLAGGKDWITNARHCDHVLVLARRRPERHFTSFCWVLLPATAPGLAVAAASSQYFSGAGVGHLRFDDVALREEYVVGRAGRAVAEFARALQTERLASALWARALCRRVLLDTLGYLRRRPAGATTLWDNAAVRDRFARCLVAVARLDALCSTYPAGPRTGAAAMVLKAASGETVEQVLDGCVALRGAEAFRDGGLARLREEAAMFGVAGGATGSMLAGVAEHADDLLAVSP